MQKLSTFDYYKCAQVLNKMLHQPTNRSLQTLLLLLLLFILPIGITTNTSNVKMHKNKIKHEIDYLSICTYASHTTKSMNMMHSTNSCDLLIMYTSGSQPFQCCDPLIQFPMLCRPQP